MMFSKALRPMAVRNVRSAGGMALNNRDAPPDLRHQWPKPNFDKEKLTYLLDHDNQDMRAKFREFMSEPVMIPR